jgi:mannose-6-phosphate isomerase-like protein (cupin superfamily)
MPTIGSVSQRAQKAILVEAGADRFNAPMDIGGWRFECKLSGQDTGGDYCIYDTVRSVRGGPPLHMHRDQDEWFYVRHGTFTFQVGTERFHVKAGDTVFGPRGVPHTFAALTDTSALLIAFQPAGAIEQLFAAARTLSKSRKLGLEEWKSIAAPRDIEIVGSPLQIA